MKNEEVFLRAILASVSRQIFSVDDILRLVAISSSKEKMVAAYNLCDGSRTQGEVAKEMGLDPGNFSRTVARWIDEGIVIKIADGKFTNLMHIYPLPRDSLTKFENKS